MTFNHGVEGSSPSALTNNIRHNLNFYFPAVVDWEAAGKQERHLRRTDLARWCWHVAPMRAVTKA